MIALATHAATLRYWIEPHGSDPQLAQWAFEAWQTVSDGGLRLEKAVSREHAQIQLLWVNGRSGLYGEARPIVVDGVRGAEVYVLPAIAQSEDELLRDTIVYLTCLHETGHALGLPHTAAFADIMYNFQYGGDIAEYFGRYRRLLQARADIRKHSGISAADRKQLIELWPH